MGGELFVGIKKDGVEHLMLRHTNALPYWFTQPTFQSGGEALQKYIDMVDEPDRPAWIGRVKQVQPSEYGIVLIDFDSKQVLSRQGYCSLGTYLFSLYSSEEESGLISNLIESNTIEEILTLSFEQHAFVPLPLDNFLIWFEKYKTDKQLLWQDKSQIHQFHIRFKSDFSIDDNNSHAAENWKEVKDFLKKNGWKSKAWTIKKTEKEYNFGW